MAINERDGLTLFEGQVSVDATSGVDVTGATIVEFEIAGDATITYESTNTDTYTIPNAGTRVGLKGSGVTTITFAGNISYS